MLNISGDDWPQPEDQPGDTLRLLLQQHRETVAGILAEHHLAIDLETVLASEEALEAALAQMGTENQERLRAALDALAERFGLNEDWAADLEAPEDEG